MSDERLCRELTLSAQQIVMAVVDRCEGACLGSCAMLARVLADHGVSTVAVRGAFGGEAHWWLEVQLAERTRLDPTRIQFDDGDPVSAVSDDGPYVDQGRFDARWSEAQALAEWDRMLAFPLCWQTSAAHILAELRDCARVIVAHAAPTLSS